LTLEPQLPLRYYQEYDEVIFGLCGFFLDLCPGDVDQDAKHNGYEPIYYGGNFPAAACFELPFEDEPRRGDNTMQPGIVNLGFRFYLPSIITLGDDGFDASPRSGAQREGVRLHARWRENLLARPEDGNFNLQGRVHRISLLRGESGDMNRLGFALAVDYSDDANTILWVHHTDIRVEL
jgi:hypothetical protein